MKRKLLAVALPITLALGVGCSNKDVAEDKKTDSLQVADKDIQEVSNDKRKAEKEYKSKLNSLLEDLTKEALVLNDVITSSKPIEEKEKEYKEKSKTMYDISEKMVALDPGDKYRDVQSIVNEVTYAVKGGLSSTKNGLIAKDEGIVHQGADYFKKVSELLVDLDKKMKEVK